MSVANPLILKLRQSGVLTEEDYEPLAELCFAPSSAPASSLLVRQGEPAYGTHLILSGFAYRCRVLASGERQIVGVLLPGDFCDLQPMMRHHSDHSAVTLTDCDVVWLDQESVDRLTLTRSRIARALWWSTLVNRRILETWLAHMGQRPADKWLAHFFCELLLRLHVVGFGEAGRCEMPLTQGQLGDLLGISNVHVNRVLKELRAKNLLVVKSRHLMVPDVTTLRAFCEFDPSYLHLLDDEAGRRM